MEGIYIALKGERSEFFASEILEHYASDEVWDLVLTHPQAEGLKRELLTIILKRSRISPEALKWLKAELESTRSVWKSSIFNSVVSWGKEALPLYSSVRSASVLSGQELDQKREALRKLSTFVDLKVVRESSVDELRAVVAELSDMRVPFNEKQARQILEILNPGSYFSRELEKNRLLFCSFLYYVETHWKSLSLESKQEVQRYFGEWMKWVPDRISDEALLRLVGQILSSEELSERQALRQMQTELREAINLK